MSKNIKNFFLSLTISTLIMLITLPVYGGAISSNDVARTSLIDTSWGYGTGENKYNQAILNAIDTKWGSYELPISPIIVKATIAIESSFCSDAISPTGYVGLMQVGTTEAKLQGLSLNPCDERFIPEKNITAALGTIKTKHKVIKHPGDFYSDKIWAVNVNKFYSKYGSPTVYQQWVLTLGAYNGGGATVLRAMNYCLIGGKDPRKWENLYCPERPSSSPLYLAILDVYGSSYATSKYYQMGNYPSKILNLANLDF